MQSMEPIRIMIVDNHKGVRMGIKTYLESHVDFELVAEASNKEEAITRYIQDKPDLVLMDMFLPDASGINVMQDLHHLNARVPVIVLTTPKASHLSKDAMAAGAACLVNKDIGGQALASAIQKAMGEFENGSVRSRSTIENIDILEK